MRININEEFHATFTPTYSFGVQMCRKLHDDFLGGRPSRSLRSSAPQLANTRHWPSRSASLSQLQVAISRPPPA
jgi:hypothetical protein